MIKGANFNIPGNNPRILVAPLDWGLGHATRCIPVIRALQQQPCSVIIAAEGGVKALLQNEFPALHFIELKGYRVQYSSRKFWMAFKLLLQLPKIFYRIYAENRWLKKLVQQNKIDAVIADNRMGLHHKKIPCIYITHQLAIKTGSRITDGLVQKIHYHYINKFGACWVPDTKETPSLAGALSHPKKLPAVPVMYLGLLSRLQKNEETYTYDVCIILSGPEPQRTFFEKIILLGLSAINGKVFLVRGLPDETTIPHHTSIEIKNHLPAAALNKLMLQSKVIVSRCGYSTVMDLVKLQKKAILVPTPGQTEQEYLATYLRQQQLFFCVDQKDFSLPRALQNMAGFNFKTAAFTDDDYKKVLENFVSTLRYQ